LTVARRADIDPALRDRLAAAAMLPGLDLLVLFGSRARGDAHAASDWDFAYLGTGELDADALVGALTRATGSDAVDIVDLARAGGLLRYRVARDGQVVVEKRPDAFERFWLDAVTFWCDAAPVLGPAYEGVLERLTR
jgi:predicted nucleotidyltransferase